MTGAEQDAAAGPPGHCPNVLDSSVIFALRSGHQNSIRCTSLSTMYCRAALPLPGALGAGNDRLHRGTRTLWFVPGWRSPFSALAGSARRTARRAGIEPCDHGVVRKTLFPG